MDVLSTVVWNGHSQWSFVRTGKVLTLWFHEGEAEPKKLQAWSLVHNENYEQFLLVLLQKFHSTPKQNLTDVVRTIIIVQNAFAMAIMEQEARAN